MGRKLCCPKEGLNRGAWTAMEDEILVSYIRKHGEGRWGSLPKRAGLKRCGKSCRLRWLNYLRPGIKRGNISGDEEELIIRLHRLLGNRWSLIAGRLPGRTDNEIKNYWNTTLGKKVLGEAPSNRRHSLKQQHRASAVVRTPSPEPEHASAAAVPLSSPRPNNASPIVRTKALRCTARLPMAPAAPSHDDGFPSDHHHGEAGAEVATVRRLEECCLPEDEDLSMPIDLDFDLGFLSPWRGQACGGAGGEGHQFIGAGGGEGDVEALLMGDDVEFTWF